MMGRRAWALLLVRKASLFEKKAGYFRETGNERIMEKVDADGNVLGFSVLKVSSLRDEPIEVSLS